MRETATNPDVDPSRYDSAEHAAEYLAHLLDRPRRCTVRAAEWRRQAIASYQSGGATFDWTPLDSLGEAGVLMTICKEALAEVRLCHPVAGERYWRAWWEVRIGGVRLVDRPAGYRSTQAAEAVAIVDVQIAIELAVRDKLSPRGKEYHRVDVSPCTGVELLRVDEEELSLFLAILPSEQVLYGGE